MKTTNFQVLNEEEVIVNIEPDQRYSPICSGCLNKTRLIHSYNTRKIYDLHMSGKKVQIHYTYRTLMCNHCGLKIEHHEFIEPYSRVTKRFSQYIFELCKVMTIQDVAFHTGLSWDQVRLIDKQNLKKKYKNQIPDNLQILCVDEISVRRRHTYLTIIADYITGQVIGVIKNRDYQSVSDFLKSIPNNALQTVKAVAMDMWDPFIKAFKECLPEARIVFDPFHIISAFSRVIDEIRAQEFRHADPAVKIYMKRSRFLLLKNSENLNEKERPRLKQILNENQLLATVYILKDYLKRLWQYSYTKSCEKFLNYWIDLANETNCQILIKFSKTLKRKLYGILNHCKYPINTGKLEGINNKIKVIKRKAYGYRDIEYFSLKIIQATTN